MKTYYISTKPESYGAFAESETAHAEAEEIADAVVNNFPNIATELVHDNTGYNDFADAEIDEVYHWIEKNWVDILSNVGVY
jgi:hypothetical protein